MHFKTIIVAGLCLALAACNDTGASDAADAQPNAPAPSTEITETDRAAIFALLGMTPNARGDVMNECGELSTPQFLPADLGGAAGNGVLFAISGGPTTAACYGDGSLLHLYVRDGARWREVYSDRGGVLIVLPTRTNGVRDIADGGPGFTFPVWQWNGREYAYAERSIGDADLGDATFLP